MVKSNSFESAALQTNAANVENAANEIANNGAAKNENGAKKAQKSSETPFWPTLTKSRTRFNAQFDKTNKLKFRCLETFMPAAYADQEKYWVQYMEEVGRLLDSKRFERECRSLGVDAMTMATHIVFLGERTFNRVRKNGIVATIGADYKLYTEKFIDEKYEQFCLYYEASGADGNTKDGQDRTAETTSANKE